MRKIKCLKMKNLLFQFLAIFIFLTLAISIGNCFSILPNKDSISNLSFNHDGKKVVFDRCRNEGCQIQVYDLETAELAAYQSPKNEHWTMGKYSYDGKKLLFPLSPSSPMTTLNWERCR